MSQLRSEIEAKEYTYKYFYFYYQKNTLTHTYLHIELELVAYSIKNTSMKNVQADRKNHNVNLNTLYDYVYEKLMKLCNQRL